MVELSAGSDELSRLDLKARASFDLIPNPKTSIRLRCQSISNVSPPDYSLVWLALVYANQALGVLVELTDRGLAEGADHARVAGATGRVLVDELHGEQLVKGVRGRGQKAPVSRVGVVARHQAHVRVVEARPKGLDVVLVRARRQVNFRWYWLWRAEWRLEQCSQSQKPILVLIRKIAFYDRSKILILVNGSIDSIV